MLQCSHVVLAFVPVFLQTPSRSMFHSTYPVLYTPCESRHHLKLFFAFPLFPKFHSYDEDIPLVRHNQKGLLPLLPLAKSKSPLFQILFCNPYINYDLSNTKRNILSGNNFPLLALHSTFHRNFSYDYECFPYTTDSSLY